MIIRQIKFELFFKFIITSYKRFSFGDTNPSVALRPTRQAGSFAKTAHRAVSLRSALPEGAKKQGFLIVHKGF